MTYEWLFTAAYDAVVEQGLTFNADEEEAGSSHQSKTSLPSDEHEVDLNFKVMFIFLAWVQSLYWL